MSSPAVIHHPGHSFEEAEDWYVRFFDSGRPGDWLWNQLEIDGQVHRTILMIVPLVPRDHRTRGKLARRGGELARVFVDRQPDNWNEPGPVRAWDGNEDAPSLNPSIFVRGEAEVKGWHGFCHRGELVNLDGSIVGE